MHDVVLHSKLSQMPTITVRGVPRALHERLKRQAKAHNRSLNGEVLELLQESASGEWEEDRWGLLGDLRNEQAATPAWDIDQKALKTKMREGLA